MLFCAAAGADWNGICVTRPVTKKIDPKYTSQRCHTCGVIRKANRKSQSVYHGSECGVAKNADVNAVLNIRESGWLKIRRSGTAQRRVEVAA